MILKTSILAIVLLFVAVDGAWWTCHKIGSGYITNSSVVGKKRDFYYHVPSGTKKIEFRRAGKGGSSYSWSRGSSIVKVRAWIRGKIWGRQEESWTVKACN